MYQTMAYRADDGIEYEDIQAADMDEAKVKTCESWEYAEPGTYEVTITGRDEDGQIVETETITVTAR